MAILFPTIPKLDKDGNFNNKDLLDYFKNMQDAINKFESSTGEAVGTIKMFQGVWEDDKTIPGWYACVAKNADKGCPNLEDKFVRGGASSGTTGGANTVTLNSSNLPPHTHSVEIAAANSDDGTGQNIMRYADCDGKDATLTYTTSNGGFANTAFSIIPTYYSLIYIRRCN